MHASRLVAKGIVAVLIGAVSGHFLAASIAADVEKAHKVAEVLDKMDRMNATDLLVCDESQKQIVGIAERDRIVARLMQALLRAPQENEQD